MNTEARLHLIAQLAQKVQNNQRSMLLEQDPDLDWSHMEQEQDDLSLDLDFE